MNKLILIGNLGKAPELNDKGNMCRFSLATSDGFGDKKKTNWHNIVLLGKAAEVAAKNLSKGSKIAIEGSIDYSEKDGKYYTNIISNSFEFVESKKTSDTASEQTNAPNDDFESDLPWK
jgi:single-strand DNA-binding protein